jgi:hypothetical protein
VGPAANALKIATGKYSIIDTGPALRINTGNQTGPTYPAMAGNTIFLPLGAASSVLKIDVVSGDTLGTIMTPAQPWAACYDGSRIWVSTNTGAVRINPRTDAVEPFVFGGNCRGIAAANGYIYVGSLADQKVYALDSQSGDVVQSWTSLQCDSIAPSTNSVWATDRTSGTVMNLRATSASVLQTVPINGGPSAVLFFDGVVYVADATNNKLKSFVPAAPTAITETTLSGTPQGLATDGTHIFVPLVSGNMPAIRISDRGTASTASQLGLGTLGVMYDGRNVWVTNLINSTIDKR